MTRLPKDRVKHMKGKETVVYQGDNGALLEIVMVLGLDSLFLQEEWSLDIDLLEDSSFMSL